MSTPNMFARGRSSSRIDWPNHLALPRHREARWRRDGYRLQAASALNHPNIVHDISRESGTDFLVMEYV